MTIDTSPAAIAAEILHPLNVPRDNGRTADLISAIVSERDKLRAENERLREFNVSLRNVVSTQLKFAISAADAFDVDLEDVVFVVRVMPLGEAVAEKSWLQACEEARAALKGTSNE